MEELHFITEEQEVLDNFEEFKKAVSSAPYETQIRAILDGLKVSTIKQVRLKDATKELVIHSKKLICLTWILIFLTAILIIVGAITIFHH